MFGGLGDQPPFHLDRSDLLSAFPVVTAAGANGKWEREREREISNDQSTCSGGTALEKRGFDCRVAVARCSGLPTWKRRSAWRCVALQAGPGQRWEPESKRVLTRVLVRPGPVSLSRQLGREWPGGIGALRRRRKHATCANVPTGRQANKTAAQPCVSLAQLSGLGVFGG